MCFYLGGYECHWFRFHSDKIRPEQTAADGLENAFISRLVSKPLTAASFLHRKSVPESVSEKWARFLSVVCVTNCKSHVYSAKAQIYNHMGPVGQVWPLSVSVRRRQFCFHHFTHCHFRVSVFCVSLWAKVCGDISSKHSVIYISDLHQNWNQSQSNNVCEGHSLSTSVGQSATAQESHGADGGSLCPDQYLAWFLLMFWSSLSNTEPTGCQSLTILTDLQKKESLWQKQKLEQYKVTHKSSPSISCSTGAHVEHHHSLIICVCWLCALWFFCSNQQCKLCLVQIIVRFNQDDVSV